MTEELSGSLADSNVPAGTVSVIVPVYNVIPYLREALDSVTGQTWQDLEIILVDDGSDDGSGELCDEYAAADPRITVIHQSNRGLSAARNAGLERMTGQALVFFDPDDVILPGMIRTMMETLCRENTDMMICGYAPVRTEGRRSGIKAGRKRPNFPPGRYDRIAAMKALAVKDLNISVWNRLYRAELWQGLRFPEGRVFEDLSVSWPLLSRLKSVTVLPDLFYLYRIREKSISAMRSEKSRKDRMIASGEFLDFVEQHTPGIFTEKERMKVRENRLVGMIRMYLCCREREDREEKERLREQAIALGKTIPMGGCAPRVRLEWSLFHRCPVLLRLAAGVWQALK